jgi:hypothetical protein
MDNLKVLPIAKQGLGWCKGFDRGAGRLTLAFFAYRARA